MNAQQGLTRHYDQIEGLTAETIRADHHLSACGSGRQKDDWAVAGPLDDIIAALRESWMVLRRRAHYLARNRVDADDLMASAVAATWEKWVDGTGPSDNIVAYITQAMRNRMIDELRSPRAGEVELDETLLPPVHVDDRSRIDHHVENTQLRTALRRLPEGMQRVLIDVVVDGRKPRDLEDEYRMSAPAISTAAYRAKKLLRSELFLEVVRGSCSDSGCALPQARVARDLGRSAELSASSTSVELLRRCGECAIGFERYLEMSDQGVA